jgi:hypothetical protein
MKNVMLLTLSFFMTHILQAQNIAGAYTGIINGEKVSLNLEPDGGGKLKGIMNDSESTYSVQAGYSGNRLKGRAKEKMWGIIVDLEGRLQDDELKMVMTMDVIGIKQSMDVVFKKIDIDIKTNDSAPSSEKSVKNPVAGKSRDSRVTGVWVKESNYSSGYGFNGSYGSLSTRETMIFNADGSMAEGASSSTISGSNYSGSSTGQGVNTLPGVFWFTEGNKLFLSITQDGITHQVELGKYYIENGKMLITASNGEKLLLYRQ